MKYFLNKKTVSRVRNGIVNSSLTFLILISGLSTALPIFLSSSAHASGDVTVTPYSMQGWTISNSSGAQVKFVPSASAPLGSGAAELVTTNDNNSVARLSLPYSGKLSSLSSLSFEANQYNDGGNPAVDGALRLSINLSGTSNTVDDQLMYEPYYNGTVNPKTWQSWNAYTGKFWSNNTLSYNGLGGVSAGSYASNFTIADVLHDHPNAKLVGVVLSLGTWNPSSQILFDNLNISGIIYDFETPPTPAQSSQTVYPSDLRSPLQTPNGWYYYDDNTDTPSTTGSSQTNIVPNPAGYTVSDNAAVMLNASNNARPAIATIRYNGTSLSDISTLGFSSYQPSSNGSSHQNESSFLNFDVDFGTGLSGYQGRLVYVPNVNGTVKQNTWQNWEGATSNGQWTWSRYYNNGSKWPDGNTSEYRTWDDIVASFSSAKIQGQLLVRAGNPDNYTFVSYTDHVYLATYQNGSNVNYNFELQPPAIPTNLSWKTNTNIVVPNGGATNVENGVASWQAVSGADHYIYKYWNDITGNQYKIGHEYITSVSGTALPGSFNQGEGIHHFCVVAVNAAGIPSACSAPFTITYDTTAPSTPTITAPSARQWFNTTPITDSWTTATDNLSGVDYYQIAYNYDDGHSFGGSTCTGLTMTGVSGFIGCRDVNGTSRGHVPGPSEQGGVTIWVRAIDNAGNVGAWSQSVHYYYDHTTPSTTITVSPVINGVFTVSGTATDNLALNRVYVQLVNTGDSQRYGGTTIDLITTPFSTSKTWSQTYDMHALGYPDGVYAADAAVTDMAGNTYDTGWTNNFTVDTTAPAAPSSASWEDSSNNVITGLTNINPIKPVWDASSSSDVAYYEYSYKAQNYGGNVWSSPSNMGANTTTGLTYLGTLAGVEGDWQFRVRAVGTNGVDSAWTYSPIITFDRTAPSAPGAPTTTSPTSSLNSTWTWTAATDANGIKGYLFDLTDSSNNSVASYPTTTPSVPTSWLTSVATYGTYTFHVRAVDNAGNIGPESTGTVVVAAPAPEVLGDSTSNTNHVYINTSSSQNSNSGNSNNNGNTSGGNSQSGSSNNTDNTSSDVSINNSGNVKGDSTSKGSTPAVNFATSSAKQSTKLLGLGWWWLVVLAAALGFFWFLIGARRRNKDENEA